LVVVGVVGLMLLVAGCPKKYRDEEPSTSAPGGGGGGGNPIIPGGGPAVGGVRGAGFKTDARAQLEQLALTYFQVGIERNQGPTVQEFLPHIRTYGKIAESVNEGYFVIVPNARLSSDVVIAYEAKADREGKRLVAFGDKHTEFMFENQFRAALQNK
jgi:hypothetical protein